MTDPKNETIVAKSSAPGGGWTSSVSSHGLGRLLALPQLVWMRLGLIFLALGLAKCGVIYALRRELFQVHWRVDAAAPTWTNWVAYYLFAILLAANLWVFGKRCASNHNVRANRVALVGILGISVAFLLLTFHQGKWNYLFSVMNGVLTWSQVGEDMKLRFIFGAPYLGAWALGFGAAWYGLCRVGRERHLVQVFAVLAPVYFVIYLREFAVYQAELLALNALGFACLVAGRRSHGAIKWPLALAPYIFMGVGFILFRSFDARIARPTPEFLVLMAGGVIVFVGGSLLAWRRGFYAEWSWLLPFASAAFLVLMTINFPMADNYRNLLVLGLALPRYFVGSAIVVLVLLCLALTYFRFRPKGSWVWLDILGLVLVALAIVDLRLTQIMEVRLDWQVISFADSPKMMWRMARPYLPAVLAAFSALIVGYVVVLKMLHQVRLGRARPIQEFVANREYVLIVFLLLGFFGVNFVAPDKGEGEVAVSFIRTSPWWKRMATPRYTNEEFIKTAQELGLGSMLEVPVAANDGKPSDLNVVLIFQESVYNKHQSLFGCTNETQPLLSRYKDRMELFPNFYSNFAGSIHARFATFTGLHPVRDFQAFTRNRVPVKSLFEVLQSQGYETSVFYSSFFDYTNFRDLLRSHGVERMFDADSMPGERKLDQVSWGLKEEETLGAILGQIKEYGVSRRKFFLSYVPAAPHYPFDGTPKKYQKYKVENISDFTPKYLNELLYMDWVISSILDELKEAGLFDDTLIVITSDHGELLGANDSPIGHGWILTPELVNVPLIVMDPRNQGYRVNARIGSQVDVLPTILDLAGVPIPPDQIYQGASLYRPSRGAPATIYLNSFRQFAIVRNGQMIFGDRDNADRAAMFSYQIANRGRLPMFILSSSAVESANIDRFDQFQEHFLQNYEDYVRALRPSRLQK